MGILEASNHTQRAFRLQPLPQVSIRGLLPFPKVNPAQSHQVHEEAFQL